MSLVHIYFQSLILILSLMSIVWIISVFIRNVSIVDYFWGLGFIVAAIFYFIKTDGMHPRKILVLTLVISWGIRLTAYLVWRNVGKGEDFRYGVFRKNYGKSYWWISFFQTFLLQGILMWLIASTLLGAMYYTQNNQLGALDFIGIIFWITGLFFESIGDLQLSRFKADPSNKGRVMDKGLWRYTRHPNYFGDSAVWWGFGLFCFAAGSYLPIMGSVLMTLLIIKVSGVALLEKSLKEKKPEYQEYARKTSAFIPWIPK